MPECARAGLHPEGGLSGLSTGAQEGVQHCGGAGVQTGALPTVPACTQEGAQKGEQECRQEPYQQCQPVHKKVPNRVSRRVPKKVCDNQGSGVLPVVKSAKPEKQIDTRKNDAVKFGQ